MRKIVLTSIGVLLLGLVFGQNADRTLIGAGGSHLESGAIVADVSIGEVATATYVNDTYVISEGFQQGNLIITEVEDLFDINIEVWPNPTTQLLNVEVPMSDLKNPRLLIYDVSGRLIMDQEIVSNTQSLDFSGLKLGSYFLKIMDENTLIKTCKILKQ